ncbi:MAG TPA: HDIG domain-containing protein [Anaerolineae bacterium]|nr:HDIG domain-containing protein [Anaerolineae bacterium]HIP71879.1 HDIG domain-containing protein [Anaerolineae bacterium]
MKSATGQSRWQEMIQSSMLWIFAITLTLGLTLIFSFNLVSSASVTVKEGEPAPEDIFAPRTITFNSELRLKQAQEEARASVSEQYRPPEGEDIGRQQLQQVAAIFAFIDTVRADTQADEETKLAYLQAIDGLTIEDQVGQDLLSMTSAEYDQVKSEVSRIVGDLMREDIREDQLRNYQRLARRSASLTLTPTQERVVTTLAPQFIIPTVIPDPEKTEAMREEAVTAVEPFPVTIAAGQRILREGDIVTASDIEKLAQLGLLEQESIWPTVTAIFMASLLSVVIITIYWNQYNRTLWQQNGIRYLGALEVLILLFALLASLMLASNNSSFIYWFPMAALSMLLGVIFSPRLSMAVTVVLAGLIGFAVPNSLELALYAAAGGLLAVLTLRDTQHFNAYFRSGLAAAVAYSVVIVMFRINQPTTEVVDLLPLLGVALANGVLSAALTLVGFFLTGVLFGITTTLQLQEMSRLDHPLLQELLRRAPGTYHHSIMVANLAEQAADKVKANSTLIRVGAFYHDIGKMNRPPFFSENQEGVNPHDSLDPYTSARIIISHVSDGLDLAKQYKLPDRIREFIAQHHGTRLVQGFYHKAVEMAGDEAEVDKEQFRYPGPRPRSREVGIMMLADVVESTSRALQPNSEKAIEKLVNTLIDDDLTEGQLDESGLTLGDIHLIRESFIKTLKGRFHVRVKYPGNEALEVAEAPAAVTHEEALLETAVAQSESAHSDNNQPAPPLTPELAEQIAEEIVEDEQG